MKLNKKITGLLAVLALATFALSACGAKQNDSSGDSKKLIIGASPTPHAEILNHVKADLKKEGYELEVKVFDDYVLPNKALEDGSIDANYFQHIPYLNLQIKENGYKFENAGAVHLEPIGIYSKDLKDIKDLKEGSTLITSNSQSDWGRIITILKEAGIVDVKEGVDLQTATFEDIEKNPKHLKFNHTLNPEVLTTAYKNNEAPLIAINSNFALTADLNPTKDALLLEKDNSPYVNVIAVREGDKDKPAVKALEKVLHKKEVQDWILKKWNGSVKPVAEDAK
ncbi:D-methionine transport system substrate-binding protein [Pilibacter termitis]|uniref:Lipoprotein n=1 Tax=Pilibacter termitis TaxID=263852 RepID=A0A1T4LM21_9ENTE|nr:MetQ/NlpA family ABC transporter substrate-binding protein [Pilibacter termitis]SJZ55578.1 D-methionine transport system substrate-binding protein [Pilibacter termitis]